MKKKKIAISTLFFRVKRVPLNSGSVLNYFERLIKKLVVKKNTKCFDLFYMNRKIAYKSLNE